MSNNEVITPSYDRATPSNPTPNPAPNVAPTAPEHPVKFTPEQQSKIDAIVREAMGRAAADTRAELAKTQAEKERLAAELKTALLAAAPDASEADRLRLQLEQERKSKEELAQNFARERVNGAILSAAQSAGLVNPQHALRLIDPPAPLADGSPDVVAIQAAIQKLSTENPNLVVGTTKFGSGSTPNGNIPPVALRPEDYYGATAKRGAAEELNRLSRSNPSAYRSLRNAAQKARLI